MKALVSAFADAFNAEGCALTPVQIPVHIPVGNGPPPLGSILALVQATGRPRKECKAALVAHANAYDAALSALMDGGGGSAGSGRASGPSTHAGEPVASVAEARAAHVEARKARAHAENHLGLGTMPERMVIAVRRREATAREALARTQAGDSELRQRAQAADEEDARRVRRV